MTRPNGQLPAIIRARNKKGAHIGSYFMWVTIPGETNASGRPKQKRVSLATKDLAKARARRLEVMNGARDFVYDDDDNVIDTPRAPEPAPVIPVVPLPVTRQLAAADAPQPIVLPPEPAPLDQRPADPVPTTAVETPNTDDWTKDAARAAGAPDVTPPTSETENKVEPAPAAQAAQPVDDGVIRVKDLAAIGPVFVTASRIAVQLQVVLHVLVARYLFKVELDPLREPDMPKDVDGFMKRMGTPFPDGDPREAGRQMWERFARRKFPDDLALPDWVLAPVLVGVSTLPTQIANAKPIVKAKPNVPVIPAKPADVAPVAKSPEPAAPPPPANDVARTRNIPVMPDMS